MKTTLEKDYTVIKIAQKYLQKKELYKGNIDGIISSKTKAALQNLPSLTRQTDYEKCIAIIQSELGVTVDGVWGPETEGAFQKHYGLLPGSWMPEIRHVRRWNERSLPKMQPKGIVLHRTTGYFSTGDYAVGKWGNSWGPKKKGKMLGFHFLVGKNKGELIQFVPINKRVNHVKAYSSSYIGIEISGDVKQYRDGRLYGEPMTEWQKQTVLEIIRYCCETKNIPTRFCQHVKKMHTMGVYRGIVGHRDLKLNDHADSPNVQDWEEMSLQLENFSEQLVNVPY